MAVACMYVAIKMEECGPLLLRKFLRDAEDGLSRGSACMHCV